MDTDRIDHQLIHALRVDGRASYARLSEVLGVSGQTVARRYRRLREAGVIRVVVVPGANAPGQAWLIRLAARPGAADRLAAAIARRADASWVSIVAGGTEILWASRPVDARQTEALLLRRLGSDALIAGVSAHMVLRTFEEPEDREGATGDPLTRHQREALGASREGAEPRPAPAPEPEDVALVRALAEDGRASYAQLGAAAGISAARARRRLEALLGGGLLRVELEIAVVRLGVATRVWVWMQVAPAALETTGRAIAQMSEAAYVAAVTGTANLVAVVVVADPATLYRFLSERLGAISAIAAMEVAPVLAQIKQEASLPRGGRLPRPGESAESAGEPG